MKLFRRIIFLCLLISIFLGNGYNPVSSKDERRILIPVEDKNPLRDVAWDDEGNIYVVAMRWDVDRPQIKSFNPNGKLRTEFQLSLRGFCCEPFPLKIIYGHDSYLYVLLPSKEGLLYGGNIQLIRVDLRGNQDTQFGENGVLAFPKAFQLRDFCVSENGKIWVLNNLLELYTFDQSNKCVLVRKLKEIFPEKIMGGELKRYIGLNLFAVKDNLLLTGIMDISSIKYGEKRYFSVLELDYDGYMVSNKEWETPWFSDKTKSFTFHSPTKGKSFIHLKGDLGSVIGYPIGIRNEPNTHALVVADWASDDGFYFYNITHLPLPNEIYLDYDLNQVFFLRNDEKTIVFFPMGRTQSLLVQVYDNNGKPLDKWFWDVHK